jgi:hypothetical protein
MDSQNSIEVRLPATWMARRWTPRSSATPQIQVIGAAANNESHGMCSSRAIAPFLPARRAPYSAERAHCPSRFTSGLLNTERSRGGIRHERHIW